MADTLSVHYQGYQEHQRAVPAAHTAERYASISLRSPAHTVWNVPSRSTRL